jgi:hypothetical protein
VGSGHREMGSKDRKWSEGQNLLRIMSNGRLAAAVILLILLPKAAAADKAIILTILVTIITTKVSVGIQLSV